ncbi:hypothetical protein VU00_12063, partial [Candidatus Electrothrix marina]
MILRNIKHLLLNLRQEGGVETLYRLCFRFLRINSFDVFCLDLSNINFVGDAFLPGAVVKEITEKGLQDLREKYVQLPSEFYINKLEPEKKYRCFICFFKEQPALIVWFCDGMSSGFVDVASTDV